MDVSRYGDWASMAYTNAKVRENYSRRFRIRFPNEELPAARPLRTTPVYDRLREHGAVFGATYGLEYALWYAPAGMAPVEDVTWRRSNAHEPVAAECRAVRAAVGMIETSTYSKYSVTGEGAAAWLDKILAGRMPAVGRIALSPMLNRRGKLIGDFTVARLGTGDFLVFGTGHAEAYHMRWFEAHLPPNGVAVRARGAGLVGFALAGPRARDVLRRLTPEDVSNASFPFFSIRRLDLGMIPATVGRLSFTGELGYEIWVTPDYQRALFDLLMEAGADLGLRLFGARALHSMRMEKSFGNWTREYRPIYGPGEAGLGRFLDFKKGDFVGRAAALEESRQGGARRLITLTIDGTEADAVGDEAVFHGGKVAGWVTSGGFGHRSGASIALAYVAADVAPALDGFEVEVLGERKPARRASQPLYDPDGARMRS
jgi:dimethylglycine dehydrogenase